MTIIENYLIEAEMSDIPFPLDPNGAKHNEESFLVFFLNPTFISNTKMFNSPPFFIISILLHTQGMTVYNVFYG